MRKIEIYNGKEIDEERITKIKQIAEARYTKPIYDSSYWSIDNVEQLAFISCINVDDEILVLGEDWFLCYTVSDDNFTFLEWVALDDNSSKFIQSIEMMNILKRILFKYRNKQFTVSMRHDTSYQFYSKMLQKGYFIESFHAFDIDYCNGFAPEQVRYIDYNYPSIEEFLNSEEAKNNPEYLIYILHDLVFKVTDTFVERCSKLNRKL